MGAGEVIIIISNIFIGGGMFFMLFGVACLFIFKDFYPRLLIASKIDTVGLLSLLLGICLRHGISFFTGKVLLTVIIILVLNPMVAHIVARSAFKSGYQLEGTLVDDGAEQDEGEKGFTDEELDERS